MKQETMKTIFISIVCGLVSAIGFTALNNHFYRQNLAVVRMDYLLNEHLKEFGGKSLDDKARQKLSAAFAQSLDAAIKEISSEERITLLVGPAVVSDIPDYTQVVRLRIKDHFTNLSAEKKG